MHENGIQLKTLHRLSEYFQWCKSILNMISVYYYCIYYDIIVRAGIIYFVIGLQL